MTKTPPDFGLVRTQVLVFWVGELFTVANKTRGDILAVLIALL